MARLVPVVPECLLSDFNIAHDASDQESLWNGFDVHASDIRMACSGKRSCLPPFRGMWRSSKLSSKLQSRPRKVKLARASSEKLSLPVAATAAPASAPASLLLSQPQDSEALADAVSRVETGSASGSRGPRGLSSITRPKPVAEPLRRETCPVVMEAPPTPRADPPTPRLGLRPPYSASSTASAPEKAPTPLANKPPKPKIAGMWGAQRRRILLAKDATKSKARLAEVIVETRSNTSRPRSQASELQPAQTKRKLLRPRISCPRPAAHFDHNLEHTILLRPNEFTTSTATYRTYGSQWVLANRRACDDGALDHLREELERERAEIAQRQEYLRH